MFDSDVGPGFSCGICGGPAEVLYVRGAERLICPNCGATHAARGRATTQAEIAPLSSVAPEPSRAPTPMRTQSPTVLDEADELEVEDGGWPREVLLPVVASFAAVLVLGVPLMYGVYSVVAGWMGPEGGPAISLWRETVEIEDPSALPGGGWAAEPQTVNPGELQPVEAPPATGDATLAQAPPAIPRDIEIIPDLSPGTLPNDTGSRARLAAASAVAPVAAADDDAEAEMEHDGALQTDRVVVRLHSSPPGAEVGIDGRVRGRTPAKLMLNPGSYELSLSHDVAEALVTLDADVDQHLCFTERDGEFAPVECTGVL